MLVPCLDLVLALLLQQGPGPFVDVSAAAGIAEDTPTFSIAAGDLDADRRTDLVLSRHGGRPRVWKNTGAGFVDLAAAQGFLTDDCHGITIADIEPDYLPELYVCVGACRGTCMKANHYYVNRFGRFFYASGSILDDPNGRGRAMTPFDVNGDRRLDLLVTNMNGTGPSRTRYFHYDASSPQRYVDRAAPNGIDQLLSTSVSILDLNDDGHRYALFDGPGADAGRVFEVDAAGGFTDVTSRMGLAIPDRWTVSQIVPFDYDSDGDLDLYVVRGVAGRDQFLVQSTKLYFRSQRPDASCRVVDSGPFRIEVRIDGIADPQRVRYGPNRVTLNDAVVLCKAKEIEGAPVILPGDSGVFVWYEQGELKLRAVRAGSVATAVIRLANPGAGSASGLVQLPTCSNLLFRNDAGTFVEATAAAGLVDSVDSGSALAEDFDNDGDLDLFVVNRGDDASNTPDFFYLNRDDGTFVEMAGQVGLRGPAYGRGDGAAAFDYDADGDLDLFVSNGHGDWPNDRGPVQLLRNELGTRNGASIQILGVTANTFAIGARIRVRRADGRMQYRVRGGMTAHVSHGLPPLFIGLAAQASTTVEVLYPSGVLRTATVASATQRIILE